MANKVVTSISIRRDILERADKAVRSGSYPGINDRSGLIEYALSVILDRKEVTA